MSSANGIVNGVCVNPELYFLSLVDGTRPQDYATVILSIKEHLWKYGIGYQARSDGTPSSRLFLPTVDCPDARPITEDEQFLGVKQVEACWRLTADTVINDAAGHPSQWGWTLGGEGDYLPLPASSSPAPVPPAAIPPPGRAEALDEQTWLHHYYMAPEGLQRPKGLWRDDTVPPGPDFEGIAAWYLDVYQVERMQGQSRADARASYVSQIRHSAEWQAKHPGETP